MAEPEMVIAHVASMLPITVVAKMCAALDGVFPGLLMRPPATSGHAFDLVLIGQAQIDAARYSAEDDDDLECCMDCGDHHIGSCHTEGP